MQIEVDLAAAHLFDILARPRADSLDHLTVLAKKNRFMGISLTDNRSVYRDLLAVIFIGRISGTVFLEFDDLNSGAVRYLLIGIVKNLLADQFGCKRSLRLVSDILDREISRSGRQP